MKDRILVVDDFYTDPDLIRKIFLDMPTDDPGKNWAGVMTDLCLFDDYMKNFMGHIVGHPVDGATALNGRVRFSMGSDEFKQDIHIDTNPDVLWAGVIYLTPDNLVPDKFEAGTQFWKHKERDISAIKMNKEFIEEQGWLDINKMIEFLETDGMDRSKWELEMQMPWKYNRLVLFRPWMFHSPGFAWGDTKENCRVVQTFFLKFDQTVLQQGE